MRSTRAHDSMSVRVRNGRLTEGLAVVEGVELFADGLEALLGYKVHFKFE